MNFSLIDIPFEKFTLEDNFFRHWSSMHGKNHVYRVMLHCLNLGEELKNPYVTKLAFCAAFIHDMERTHDGYCLIHGKNAAELALPKFKDLFLSIGVKQADFDVIAYAVIQHSLPDEEFLEGIYTDVTNLLKDADGLDRVRLGDLDTSYLRLPFTYKYERFANIFYDKIEKIQPTDFLEVIKVAESILMG